MQSLICMVEWLLRSINLVYLSHHPQMGVCAPHCVHGARVLSHFSYVLPLVTLWTVARQVPLSIGLSIKNPGVDCHFLLQGIFLTQGSGMYPVLAGRFFTTNATWETHAYRVKWGKINTLALRLRLAFFQSHMCQWSLSMDKPEMWLHLLEGIFIFLCVFLSPTCKIYIYVYIYVCVYMHIYNMYII